MMMKNTLWIGLFSCALGCVGASGDVGGCGRDSDCAEGRVCVERMCVDHDAGAPAPDVQTPGSVPDRPVPPIVCGNHLCDPGESCATCPGDCSCTTLLHECEPCTASAECADGLGCGTRSCDNRRACMRPGASCERISDTACPPPPPTLLAECAPCSSSSECSSGLSCNARRCDGRTACFRPDGTCASIAGAVCPALVSVGGACTSDAMCAPDSHGSPTSCAIIPGWGHICVARCASNGGCNSGCCVPLNSGVQVCAPTEYCSSATTCFAAPGGACVHDANCCPTSSGVPAICVGTAGSYFCDAMCASNADCPSRCCRPASDGLLICRPSTEC